MTSVGGIPKQHDTKGGSVYYSLNLGLADSLALHHPIAGKHFSGSSVSGAGAELRVCSPEPEPLDPWHRPGLSSLT